MDASKPALGRDPNFLPRADALRDSFKTFSPASLRRPVLSDLAGPPGTSDASARQYWDRLAGVVQHRWRLFSMAPLQGRDAKPAANVWRRAGALRRYGNTIVALSRMRTLGSLLRRPMADPVRGHA